MRSHHNASASQCIRITMPTRHGTSRAINRRSAPLRSRPSHNPANPNRHPGFSRACVPLQAPFRPVPSCLHGTIAHKKRPHPSFGRISAGKEHFLRHPQISPSEVRVITPISTPIPTRCRENAPSQLRYTRAPQPPAISDATAYMARIMRHNEQRAAARRRTARCLEPLDAV